MIKRGHLGPNYFLFNGLVEVKLPLVATLDLHISNKLSHLVVNIYKHIIG